MTPEQAATALVSIAEAACALAAQQRLEELAALEPEWNAAVAALPRPLPAHLVPVVRHAHELQGTAVEALASVASALAGELAQLDRTRAGVRAYAPAQAPPSATVNTAV